MDHVLRPNMKPGDLSYNGRGNHGYRCLSKPNNNKFWLLMRCLFPGGAVEEVFGLNDESLKLRPAFELDELSASSLLLFLFSNFHVQCSKLKMLFSKTMIFRTRQNFKLTRKMKYCRQRFFSHRRPNFELHPLFPCCCIRSLLPLHSS